MRSYVYTYTFIIKKNIYLSDVTIFKTNFGETFLLSYQVIWNKIWEIFWMPNTNTLTVLLGKCNPNPVSLNINKHTDQKSCSSSSSIIILDFRDERTD